MIRYPQPLKRGDTIGITASSAGVTGSFSERLDQAILNFERLGFKCVETKSVRKQSKLASASPKDRAKEFMDLYTNEDVKIIIPPWGGSFLIEILPFIDYELIKQIGPKWLLGFSDTSLLLFSFLTKLDFASAHGPNALDFGADPVHESVLNTLSVLGSNGESGITQYQSELFQQEWKSIADNSFVPYNLEGKTTWKSLENVVNQEIEGRLIGGCLDVICKLIGTPFALVEPFIARNKDKGFIWYFESCDMNAADISITLTQMEMNGWFNHCNGIMFGRLEGYSDVNDYTFKDTLKKLNDSVNVPIIYDIDIGHIPPQVTLINGAFAKVKLNKGLGEITQFYR